LVAGLGPATNGAAAAIHRSEPKFRRTDLVRGAAGKGFKPTIAVAYILAVADLPVINRFGRWVAYV
jgi:hypothetical protein